MKSVFSYREFFELPFEMGGEDIRGGKGGGFSRCFQVSPGALRAGGDAQCRLQRKTKNINNVKSQAQCLKITQNVSIELFNFGIFYQFLSYLI